MITERVHSRARRLGVVALGVLAATAGSITIAGTAAAAPSDAPPNAPDLGRYYSQQLAWGPCAPFARTDDEKKMFADPGLDCARLEVPLDYADPDGGTARIAVLRSRTHAAKSASLVLNPGGPGGAGLAFAANMARFYGGGPFDVIGFDPRGVGASTPALDCLTADEARAARTATGDGSTESAGTDEVAESEAQTRNFIHKCEERSGGRKVLANVGTRDVARDLDVLRAVLGDRKLTYVGYSYGTRIGSTYAEMFPRNVRAMVLDGAIDPTETAAHSQVAQYAGFQHAFEVYAADCAKKPSCPLGSDPRKATAAYQALTRPLLTKPLKAAGGRSLSYGDATTGTIEALYSQAEWPDLTKALTAMKAGNGGPMLTLADSYYTLDTDAQTAINCVDQDRITDRAVAGRLARQTVKAAPFLDSGVTPVATLDVCGLWPVPPTSTPHLPHAKGLPPVLVISTTGDPATPYAAGVKLADALHGRLLTVEGTQHGEAGRGNPCVDQAVVTYLLTLEVPAEGTRCTVAAAP